MSSDNRHLAMGGPVEFGSDNLFFCFVFEGIDKEKIHKCQVNRSIYSLPVGVPSSLCLSMDFECPISVTTLFKIFTREVYLSLTCMEFCVCTIWWYFCFFVNSTSTYIFHKVECRTKSLIYTSSIVTARILLHHPRESFRGSFWGGRRSIIIQGFFKMQTNWFWLFTPKANKQENIES